MENMNEVFYTETIRNEDHKTEKKSKGLIITACIISILCGGFIGLGIGVGIPLAQNIILPRLQVTEAVSRTEVILSDPVQDAKGFSFENKKEPVTAVITENEIRIGFNEAIKKTEPSVVCITSVSQSAGAYFYGLPFESTSAGTGIIFHETDDRIYIVTNNHVIDGASYVSITVADGGPVKATLVGKDQVADLAVLTAAKEDLSAEGIKSFVTANFGDSSRVLVGDFVLSLGNALGEGITASLGIVSAKDRDIVIGENTHQVIQTDNKLITGFSGGPLINLNGEVIGINTARLSPSSGDIGYSITADAAKPIIEELMNQKPRPFLGIEGENVTDEIAGANNIPKFGVMVRSVRSGSSAEEGGIISNDIITSFNGMTIQNFEQLSEAISECEVGDTIDVKVLRNGKSVNITVTLKAYDLTY